MAVQKKKKQRANLNRTQEFIWTAQRKKAAEMIASGRFKQKEVAEELRIREETVSRWMHTNIFLDEVNRLTLNNELATKAGLLRLAFQAVDTKKYNLKEDKNTVLDWAEFIVKVLPEDTKNDDDKLKALTDAILESAK